MLKKLYRARCTSNTDAIDPTAFRGVGPDAESDNQSVRLDSESNNAKGCIPRGESKNSRNMRGLNTIRRRCSSNNHAIDSTAFRDSQSVKLDSENNNAKGCIPRDDTENSCDTKGILSAATKNSSDTRGTIFKKIYRRRCLSDTDAIDPTAFRGLGPNGKSDINKSLKVDSESNNARGGIPISESKKILKGKSDRRRKISLPSPDIIDQPAAPGTMVTKCGMTKSFLGLVKTERQYDWCESFYELDPRHQIFKFFNDVAREGANRIEETHCIINAEADCPPILRKFSKAAAFSVWRPTSDDAIRKMMTGEGTGKGLDIKGKSAKKGKLSGFVPFLQIHEEKHKHIVRWPPRDGSIRLYFKSEAARNRAALELTSISDQMVATVSEANKIIANPCADYLKREVALQNLSFIVTDPSIKLLDDYAPLHFGIIVAERVFFNAIISMQDISRSPEYETGRASNPDFQDMNSTCVRKYKGSGPRAVVLQYSESVDDVLNSQSLIMAYEELGRVLPVVSDFDCFLFGTRNVYYNTPLSKDQCNAVKWLLTQIESILDSPITPKSWTSRWLEVLKKSAANGYVPKMPQFGFADAKSYAIMECAVERLQKSGAVRHNAESSNYFFPQELDEQFLVISDDMDGKSRWKYVNVEELQDILCKKIDEGYAFPLNPKWILADRGWKTVYDKMMASADKSIQQSLDVWYPRGGVREHISNIHRRFPDGFQRSKKEDFNMSVKMEGTEAMDLAEQNLRRYLLFKVATFKVKMILSLRNSRRALSSK